MTCSFSIYKIPPFMIVNMWMLIQMFFPLILWWLRFQKKKALFWSLMYDFCNIGLRNSQWRTKGFEEAERIIWWDGSVGLFVKPWETLCKHSFISTFIIHIWKNEVCHACWLWSIWKIGLYQIYSVLVLRVLIVILIYERFLFTFDFFLDKGTKFQPLPYLHLNWIINSGIYFFARRKILSRNNHVTAGT